MNRKIFCKIFGIILYIITVSYKKNKYQHMKEGFS